MKKKVLVLGATGTMGHYLTLKLLEDDCQVDAVSLEDKTSENPNLRYLQVRNAKDPAFVAEITKNHYDAVVDFMIYDTVEKYRAIRVLVLLPRVCKRGKSHSGNLAPIAGCKHGSPVSVFG